MSDLPIALQSNENQYIFPFKETSLESKASNH